MIWRPAIAADVPAISALSHKWLGAMGEDDFVFANRLALCSEGCFVLSDGENLGGYLVSHPWRRFEPPALHRRLGRFPPALDCWYIHDVAVDDVCRGHGAARQALGMVADAAKSAGLGTLALVAVGGAAPYWRRQGFQVAGDHRLRRALAPYGPDALYMERPA